MKKTIVIITTAIMLFASTAYALDSFKFYRNAKGDQTFAVSQGHVDSYLLTADTAKTIAIPTGSRYVIFASTADIWVRIGGSAAIPTGDTSNGTGSMLNPICRWIEGQTYMTVVSAYAAKISISYYE